MLHHVFNLLWDIFSVMLYVCRKASSYDSIFCMQMCMEYSERMKSVVFEYFFIFGWICNLRMFLVYMYEIGDMWLFLYFAGLNLKFVNAQCMESVIYDYFSVFLCNLWMLRVYEISDDYFFFVVEFVIYECSKCTKSVIYELLYQVPVFLFLLVEFEICECSRVYEISDDYLLFWLNL